MYKVKIIALGKIKEDYYCRAADEYIKRSKKFAQIEIIELKEERVLKNNATEIDAALEREAQSILKHTSSGYAVALTPEGKKMTSLGLSEHIENSFLSNSEIVFIIGSSHGLSKTVKSRAELLLSLSDMTFPHALARVMLAEQLYRSFSIINNTPYHK